MKCRCFFRGWSVLGLFNTLCGCLIGRVLVRCIDICSRRTVGWRWDRAEDWPPDWWGQ